MLKKTAEGPTVEDELEAIEGAAGVKADDLGKDEFDDEGGESDEV